MTLVEVALNLPVKGLFTYSLPMNIVNVISPGHSVLVPFRNFTIKGVIISINAEGSLSYQGEKNKIREITTVLNSENPVSCQLMELTRWLSEEYGCSWGEALALIYASPKVKKKTMPLPETLDRAIELEAPLLLTPEQSEALQKLENSLEAGKMEPFLLFGITSSGKTEVYMRIIQEVLKKGKQALFLVPEISLCYPFYSLLKKRFGGRVGVWHSQKTPREKSSQIEMIKSGQMDILIGARSALFAPMERLGVIILDEEHDHAYKQDEKPRYHARKVALRLAEIHQSLLLLGSATPSVESFYNAQEKRYTLLTLKERVPTHCLPRFTVVDRKKSQTHGSPFTAQLFHAIRVTLNKRQQSILALNRRGFSTFLLCPNCGYVWKCANCQLTLVHHRVSEIETDGENLQCHFCFEKKPLPKACPDCKSEALYTGGFGTQRIVQDLKKHFPRARVVRLDRDVPKPKAAMAQAYETFRDEAADILVGTQMVTQGFDFPRVTLVGILDADTALYHPDFRAAERTFQWITQAGGRAGRSALGGEVVIQSVMPDHYALLTACQNDYPAFYRQEIDFRRSLNYPPFTRLVLLRVQSKNKKEWVAQESDRLCAQLQTLECKADFEVLGPGPAPKEQLNKELRWHILVKCRTSETTRSVALAMRSFIPKSGVKLVVDVDPYNIL